MSLKQQFHFFQQYPDFVYLDSAATTQKPQAVLEAINQAYIKYNANVHRSSHHIANLATNEFEQARTKVAAWLNVANKKQIIFTKGATESINIVANGIKNKLNKDDVILVETNAHHANIVPWQQLAKERQAQLVFIKNHPSGSIDLDHYQKLLKLNPKIVAVTHVSNVLGSVNDVQLLTSLAHQHDAKILIDGAQAVAHLAVDVTALDCDYYVFSGHKMYAPQGVGVLAGKLDALAELEPLLTGGEMVRDVQLSGSLWQDLPYVLEAGTPNIAAVIALGVAVDWLTGLSFSLSAAEKELLQQLQAMLLDLPEVSLYSTEANIVSCIAFNINNQHHFDVASMLDSLKVAIRSGYHCAMPTLQTSMQVEDGCCRFSVGAYTDQDDLNAAISALKQTITVLKDV